MRSQLARVLGLAVAAAAVGWAQVPRPVPPSSPVPPAPIAQPDAQRTQQELNELFQHYPPSVRRVLALDPSLLSDPSYLAPYPAITSFLAAHPDVIRNPTYYIGPPEDFRRFDNNGPSRAWEETAGDVAGVTAFAVGAALVAWLVRTFMDYRRWNRLTKVQTDAHTKILDRLASNEDLMAYVQSPAGAKFLESSPISLDAAPRSLSAPLGRIIWTGQAGVVLLAGGVGLQIVSRQTTEYDASAPLHALGILGVALGVGLVVSAVISFLISRHLGLVGRPAEPPAHG